MIMIIIAMRSRGVLRQTGKHDIAHIASSIVARASGLFFAFILAALRDFRHLGKYAQVDSAQAEK